MKLKEKSGVITLEACISLILFTFLMLFFSGLMVLYAAQSEMSHVLLETSESMSLDPYAIKRLNTTGDMIEANLGTYVSQFITMVFGNNGNNPYFATSVHWYDSEKDELPNIAKNRFIGYLSNGDESKADDILKRYNVVSGLSGLDFSESKVDNGNLYLKVKYTLEYEFNPFGLFTIPMEQTVKVKLFQ